MTSLTVARLSLESYIRSNWLWGEVVIVLGLFAALFFPFPVSLATLFGAAGTGLYALAILGAAIMVRHSISGRTYLALAKLPSRRPYLRGLMLATAILRLPLYALLLILALSFQRLLNLDFGTLLVGSIGLLANCWLLSVLTVALSAPMATRLTRIVFVAWLLAAIAPFDKIASFLTVLRLPLLPVAACFSMGVTGSFEWFDALALVVQILLIAIITLVAGFWLERRELFLY